MGPLDDLFLNSVLCNLSFSILLVPWQPITVQQPIEAISHLVGDRQPLGEWQLVPLTQTFLQNSWHLGKVGCSHHWVHLTNYSCALSQIRTPRHKRNCWHYPCCLSVPQQVWVWWIVQDNPALIHISLSTCILGLQTVAYEQHPYILNNHADQYAPLTSLPPDLGYW